MEDLREIVLEDSYVLGICATPGCLRIEGEFVLTPEHPLYAPPSADENACYARGHITFAGVRRLVWENQGAPPAVDANGELDYGHIDHLRRDSDMFELEGDWGRICVSAPSVRLVLGPDPDGRS